MAASNSNSTIWSKVIDGGIQVCKQFFFRFKKRFRNLKSRGRLLKVNEKPLAFMDKEELESEISNKIISIKKIINET